MMWAVVLAWGILTVVSAIAQWRIGQDIVDELERDLPIEKRPSWRLWQPKGGLSLAKVRAHAVLYPKSKARVSWMAAVICLNLLVASGLVGVIAWNIKH